MSLRHSSVALLFLLLPVLPSGAAAQIYKWVDANGVVNYGDKPPASAKGVQPLAENGGGVSVVPGIPKEELEQKRERDTQRRVQQLEREVDELRARNIARDQAVPYTTPPEVYPPAYPYGYGYGWGFPRRPLHPPVFTHRGHRHDHMAGKTQSSNRPRPAKSPLELAPNGSAARSAAGRG